MTRITPEKKYQLWQNGGCEGWGVTFFDNLQDALDWDKYCSEWLITKSVEIIVKDGEE